jgi:hypothetical protein
MDKTAQDFARKILSNLIDIKRLIYDAISIPRKQHYSSDEKDNTSNNCKQPADANTLSGIGRPQPAEDKHDPTANKQPKSFPRLRRYKPLIEAVGIGFLVIYTLVTVFLYLAAREANKINREALESVQRAFVYLSNLVVIFPPPSSPDTDIVFQADWQNSGNTPATSATQWVSSDWRKGLLPYETFDYPEKPSDNSILRAPVKFYIAPHDHAKGTMLKVPRKVIEGMTTDIFVHFWGQIHYMDAFKRHHRSEFCMRIIGFDPVAKQVIMTPCPEHNCADEDCKDNP